MLESYVLESLQLYRVRIENVASIISLSELRSIRLNNLIACATELDRNRPII